MVNPKDDTTFIAAAAEHQGWESAFANTTRVLREMTDEERSYIAEQNRIRNKRFKLGQYLLARGIIGKPPK